MALSRKKQRKKKSTSHPTLFEEETFVHDVEFAQPLALDTPTLKVAAAAATHPPVVSNNNSDIGTPTSGVSAVAFLPIPASGSSIDGDEDEDLDLGTPTPGVPVAASLPAASSSSSSNNNNATAASLWTCDYVSSPLNNLSPESNHRRQTEASIQRPPIVFRTRRFNPKKRKQRPTKIDSCPDYLHFDDPDPEAVEQYIEQAMNLPKYVDFLNFAFCCAVCKCPQEVKDHFLAKAMEQGHNTCVVQSGTGGKAHRACCHRHQFAAKIGIVGPVDNAIECTREEVDNEQVIDPEMQYQRATRQTIQTRNRSAESTETALFNDSKLADPAAMLYSNEEYTERAKKFVALSKLIKEGKIERRGITLISCFAGIASDMVALKRLGIKIDKVIYIEFDTVARLVYKFNHDPSFNGDLPDDGIEHIYVDSFEAFVRDFETFMEEHGPFDIVTGGPPCTEFTRVNSYRNGTSGKWGNLMIQFGALIKKIQDHEIQKERHLFFLAENVLMDSDDLKVVSEAFGVVPIKLESSCVSACRRVRFYWTNFPVKSCNYANKSSANISAERCLEEGWQLVQDIVEPRPGAKAFTFMASFDRLDDERMRVYKRDPEKINSYIQRSITAEERGAMMGFPAGYVTNPLKHIFYHSLAGLKSDSCEPDEIYTSRVPQKYHCLSGELVKIENHGWCITSGPKLKAAFAPPTFRDETCASRIKFFNEEAYGKRLFGNAWNLPTVESLLEPLKEIFAEQEYEGYDYLYSFFDPDVEMDE